MSDKDFSNLPSWLPKKIAATGLTTEQVAHRTGVSRTMMYDYMADDARPSEETMLKMSRVLGVPFEEALAQYTPKKNGRPPGKGGTSELKVRKR